MATTRLFQNQKTVKKDRTAAVYALVHIDNKSIKIGTGVSVTLERFDLKEGRVKGNSKDDNDANLIIDRCLSTINQIFVRYRLQNRILTADLLLKEYKKTLSFAEIDLKFITSFKNWCRISEGNSVNTIQKKLGYFRAYMNIAKREEITWLKGL